MKLKTSFRLLFFFLAISFYFIRPSTVAALEEYDPTKSYTVHSVPVLTDESQVSIQSENKSETLPPSPSFQTTKDVQQPPSGFDNLKNFSSEITKRIQHYVQDRWVGWVSVLLVFSGTSVLGFFLFNSKFMAAFLKRAMKASTNSQIRLVGLISGVLLSATTGVAIITAYNQQIAFFENLTGWQFTPLNEDLFIVGGILLVNFIFLAGPALVLGAKSLLTAAPALAPKWKKIFSYFAKETKSAFTETEKECEDNINKCSSLFDKTVILIFNYLPGSMPDLGMDDAIINFKNSLLHTSQPQPQKAK